MFESRVHRPAPSPKGASYVSPGQRPGFSRPMRAQTLKGWTNLIPPLQGSRCVGPNRLPGRCPGLSCCALSGRRGGSARGTRGSNTQRRSSPPKMSRTHESLVMRKPHARKFARRTGWALDSRYEARQGSHLPLDGGGIGSKGCRHDGLFTGVAGIQTGTTGIRTGAARIRDQIDQL